MADFEYEEAWVRYESDSLAQRYGVGTFVAVFDAAVIDWGPVADDVRARAEKVLGEPVFVGAVPARLAAEDDYDAEDAENEANYERLKAAAKGRKFQRRVSMWKAYDEVAFKLDILGQKTEYWGGYLRIDGTERRFSDADYRLLVEHGAIPKDTELIAGVVFWKKDAENPDTADLDD